MKMKMLRSIAIVLLGGIVFILGSCSGSSSPGTSPQDQQLAKLSKTWKATTVTQAGGTPGADYSAMVMTITSTAGQTTFNYSNAGRPTGTKSSCWAPSGTFAFGTDFATTLNRDDGTVITYSVSDTNLQLNFTYSGAGYDGRTSNVTGAWVFTFTKQ